jgi:serine O-acetyltransferase
VTLYHQVTLGVSGGAVPPTVEDGAYIGAGAKIVGAISIGEHAKVGANAVVVRDVPAGVTVGGIPARPLVPRKSGTAHPAAEQHS